MNQEQIYKRVLELVKEIEDENNKINKCKEKFTERDIICFELGYISGINEKQMPLKIKEGIRQIKDYESVSLCCPKCNWGVNDGDKFCRHCGQAITL